MHSARARPGGADGPRCVSWTAARRGSYRRNEGLKNPVSCAMMKASGFTPSGQVQSGNPSEEVRRGTCSPARRSKPHPRRGAPPTPLQTGSSWIPTAAQSLIRIPALPPAAANPRSSSGPEPQPALIGSQRGGRAGGIGGRPGKGWGRRWAPPPARRRGHCAGVDGLGAANRQAQPPRPPALPRPPLPGLGLSRRPGARLAPPPPTSGHVPLAARATHGGALNLSPPGAELEAGAARRRAVLVAGGGGGSPGLQPRGAEDDLLPRLPAGQLSARGGRPGGGAERTGRGRPHGAAAALRGRRRPAAAGAGAAARAGGLWQSPRRRLPPVAGGGGGQNHPVRVRAAAVPLRGALGGGPEAAGGSPAAPVPPRPGPAARGAETSGPALPPAPRTPGLPSPRPARRPPPRLPPPASVCACAKGRGSPVLQGPPSRGGRLGSGERELPARRARASIRALSSPTPCSPLWE